MELKLFGCRVYLSYLFVVMIILLISVDKSGTVLPCLFASFIHETGHIFAMMICRVKIDEMVIQPAAVVIKRRSAASESGELIISIGGVAFNIIFAAVFYLLLLISPYFLALSAANVAVALFNVSPVKGLDGYDILHNILARSFGMNMADKICKIAAAAFIIIIIISSVLCFVLLPFDVGFAVMVLYIIIIAIISQKS